MKTPTGRFRIAEKIGAKAAIGTVFKNRRPVRVSKKAFADEDLVMTRILWLEGLEKSNANTFDRYIYIHGTNHEDKIGKPASHGCVRMRNDDMAELFDLVSVKTRVSIRR